MSNQARDKGPVPRAVEDVADIACRSPYTAAAVMVIVTGLAAVKYLEVVGPWLPWRSIPFDILRQKVNEWTRPEPEKAPAAATPPTLRAVT